MSTKLPFEVTIMDKEPQRVTNRFGGDSVMLDPEAVAVYDVIMGAEMMGLYGEMQKGLDWFRENHPKAYMVLLDWLMDIILIILLLIVVGSKIWLHIN